MEIRSEQKNSLLFIRLQMKSALTLKFRDRYNYRKDGEETAETSLDTVFWEFGKKSCTGRSKLL